VKKLRKPLPREEITSEPGCVFRFLPRAASPSPHLTGCGCSSWNKPQQLRADLSSEKPKGLVDPMGSSRTCGHTAPSFAEGAVLGLRQVSFQVTIKKSLVSAPLIGTKSIMKPHFQKEDEN